MLQNIPTNTSAPRYPFTPSHLKKSGRKTPPPSSSPVGVENQDFFTHDAVFCIGNPTNTPNPKNISVTNALGRPVTKSVSTPEAQHDENAIPNPNSSPPKIKPKLIGFIQRSYALDSALNKIAAVNTHVIKNINIMVLISFVEPVLYARLTLPANPVYALVKA
ncbi:hypothetical protein SDC9_152645 [bioreactor metagenome]|uniref:Uncharacterized protein n=1 Tax=bioreactor metagenome TaxID=1076179 RepID=A0A645ETN8_9ZZZZ